MKTTLGYKNLLNIYYKNNKIVTKLWIYINKLHNNV